MPSEPGEIETKLLLEKDVDPLVVTANLIFNRATGRNAGKGVGFEYAVRAKYPLQRPLYIYVNRAPGKPLEPLAREFLAFVLSEEGQQIGAVDGMLPLPLALAAAEQARLQ